MKIKKITEVLIGSNNKGKVREIKALLPKKVRIFTTRYFNLSSPKETGKTFLENSLIKARYFSKKSKKIFVSATNEIWCNIRWKKNKIINNF